MARNGEEFDGVYKKAIKRMMKYHIHLIPLATETVLCILSNWTSQNVNSQSLCRAYNAASCDDQIIKIHHLQVQPPQNHNLTETLQHHLKPCPILTTTLPQPHYNISAATLQSHQYFPIRVDVKIPTYKPHTNHKKPSVSSDIL